MIIEEAQWGFFFCGKFSEITLNLETQCSQEPQVYVEAGAKVSSAAVLLMAPRGQYKTSELLKWGHKENSNVYFAWGRERERENDHIN